MWTLLFALICALLMGRAIEGTTRVRQADGFGLLRLGRVAVGVWCYRPGRVYYRLGRA